MFCKYDYLEIFINGRYISKYKNKIPFTQGFHV